MKKNKVNKKILKKKKGFSLIESLVAIFIFTSIIALLAGSFSGFFKSYVGAKKAQRNLENIQYVMNLMTKTIRSSTLDSSSFINFGQIMMYDNLKKECVVFNYDTSVLSVAIAGDGGVAITDMSKCAAALAAPTYTPMTKPGEITAVSISGTPSVAGTSVGKVILFLKSTNDSQLQTTISLRGIQ